MGSASRSRRPGHAGTLAVALVLAACACSRSHHPVTKPAPEPEFSPTTPVNAVRALEWCWDHLDLEHYGELLGEDFLFRCATTDSAGSAFRGNALTRFDEIESARHLFAGGGTSPRANNVMLQLDWDLVPHQDARRGKQDMTYHQEIVTSVVLRIETDEEDFQVTGAARFFLVRGDSAVIPAELVARGFRPDAARWYIERWEDETVGSPAALREQPAAPSLRAQPSRNTTWCDIKALYGRAAAPPAPQ